MNAGIPLTEPAPNDQERPNGMKRIWGAIGITAAIVTIFVFVLLDLPTIIEDWFPEPEDSSIHILLLDATNNTSHRPLETVKRELQREYPYWIVETQFTWVDKRIRTKSLLFWQKAQNEKHARTLASRLPTTIELRSYDDDPGGYFGFDQKRDLVLFIGDDYRLILNGLRDKSE